MSAVKNAVYVRNIPNETDRTGLMNYFSFCGPIVKCVLVPETENRQHAAIVFEETLSAHTAIVLTDANLNGAAIQVRPLLGEVAVDGVQDEVTTESSEAVARKPKFTSMTESLASLVAAGHSIGTKAFDKALIYDRAHGVSEIILQKLRQIDEKYQVTERVVALKDVAVTTVQDLDAKYDLQEKAKNGVETGKAIAQAGVQYALTFESVKSAVAKVGEIYDQAQVESEFLIAETKKKIAEGQTTDVSGSQVEQAATTSTTSDEVVPSKVDAKVDAAVEVAPAKTVVAEPDV